MRGNTGYIGQQNFIGGAAALVNQGTIVADVGGGTITVNVNGTTFNQGTMKATNGGTLLLNTAVDNSGGVLLADVGSTVRMSGMTVTGGTLNSNGTGAFTATASGSNFLNGVTLNGTLDLATSQSVERISAGGMVLNGAINIAKGSILAPQGNQTISGSGNIVFADNNASNRLNVEVGTLTLGSSVTVSGNTGYIGQQNFIGGAAGLNNQGTINADGGGTITINVNGAVVNDGTMRAQSGTLLVQSGLTGTGTLRVDSAGAMNLANGGNTQGTLTMGAAGAALNIGNGNLTINNDYTNVGAGSGNVFNRLAGISGTGQVVAGGNAAQAITGANVSNGNTANATLTINNVRVGATTFGYQIANTGNTGPTLRGAIQTGVNGASLGDTRLSGAGVTAGNYSTGAPGSNSGNLAVTFNAAAAGALAPLNNQVLNLTSNFANIADQKLNIVLGAGAAAYNAAVGSTTPNPVTVANQRIGGSNTAALTVSNTAAAGAFSEDLKTSFGGNAGAATNNAGTINALLAGSNDNATMRVGVNTASAGAQTGTVTLNYQTTGTVNGVANGLGVAGANAPQAVTVNGNVYQMAQTNAGVVPAVVNLGNFRAGAGAQSQTINILNVNAGAPVGFQEGLTAVIGGTGGGATGTGFANAAVGNTGALQLGLAGIAAGANSGTVQVQLQSNGITSSGNNGLGSLNLGAAQTVTVNGAGYVAAAGAIQTPALNFGNVQAGTQVTQNLVIRNTALGPNGYVEDLNASFATGVGTGLGGNLISGVGSLSGILAGANSSGANGAMTVTVNTGSAGVINGGIGVNYFTAGAVNGVANGLGASQVGGESYGVAGTIQAGGNVIDQAKPVVNGVANPALVTVALGNVRVNDVAGQTLTVLNQATGNQQAFLNSSIASNGGPATASGSFNGLAPGASISAPGGIGTPLKVGIDTSVAGARNGSATISHVSDITSFGNCGSSCTLNLASQTVNVSANVYQVAQPTLPANVNLGATRVGGSLLGAVSVTNTLNAPVGFQEGLNASVASSTGVAVSGSPISNLAAGSTDNTSILVGLGAATAGAKSGSVTLGLASNGSTTSGLANKALGNSAPISVTGAVYQTAVLSATTAQPTIDFGIVRVGTGVGSQNITISNVAAVTAGFNDTLKASVSGLSGPLTAVPNGISALIAGGAAGFAAVSLNTGPGNAGIYSQTAHVSSLSQDGVLADVSGGSADVTVKAQINNLANAVFSLASGAGNFSGGGSSYTLNLGNVLQGSLLNSSLSLTNLIAGPADDLRGVFDLSNLAGFFVSGWNATNLAAGATQTGLGLQYSALNLGNFARSITFNGNSFNASQGAFALGPITINILGDVVQSGPGNVPEPGTLALLTAAAVAGWMTRRRPPLARRAA